MVIRNSKKYESEFKQREWAKFHIGDKILIKNESKKNKMDDEFKEDGIIVEICPHDSYYVETVIGKRLFRHASHLC